MGKPLTRPFSETIRDRARRDPAYRLCLLKEALAALRNGEAETAEAVLTEAYEAYVAAAGEQDTPRHSGRVQDRSTVPLI